MCLSILKISFCSFIFNGHEGSDKAGLVNQLNAVVFCSFDFFLMIQAL